MDILGDFGVPLGSLMLPKAQVFAAVFFRVHLLVHCRFKIQKKLPLKWIETSSKSIFVEKNDGF